MNAATATPVREDASLSREHRKVLAGTMIGTTIEWYDFFVYAQAAGLVLGPLFFAPLVENHPGWETILSFATIGVSFLFRPLGAIVVGQLGDKIGRKKMLVLTLLLMGAATTLIGLLPTYSQIGIAATFGLILLRILQGFSAGGEWGGAVLMSVEHAPRGQRGWFGAYPQIGVPVGMILASGTLYIIRSVMSDEDFMEWGWRLPFLLSVALIFVGWLIRRTVEESPVFVEMHQRASEAKAPMGQVIREHFPTIIKCALTFAGINAAGYMVITFFGSRAIKQGLPAAAVTLCLTLSAVFWLVTTLMGGKWSDKWGRIRTHQIGYVLLLVATIPTFLLTDQAGKVGSIVMFGVALWLLMPGNGLAYGPTSALFAELFPAEVRYSGVALSYALGSIVGGAFAPMIAQSILQATGGVIWIAVYIMALCVISLIAVSLLPETKDWHIHLNKDEDARHQA